MKLAYKNFPHLRKDFCICDAHMDAISFSTGSIRFVFSKGLSKVTCDEVETEGKGYIELMDCDAEEFSCYFVQREPTSAGAQIYGKPISLVELANMLSSEESKIEIFLELYDFNYLHWRGVLLPHKNGNLSNHIIIETSGRFTMICCWDDFADKK